MYLIPIQIPSPWKKSSLGSGSRKVRGDLQLRLLAQGHPDHLSGAVTVTQHDSTDQKAVEIPAGQIQKNWFGIKKKNFGTEKWRLTRPFEMCHWTMANLAAELLLHPNRESLGPCPQEIGWAVQRVRKNRRLDHCLWRCQRSASWIRPTHRTWTQAWLWKKDIYIYIWWRKMWSLITRKMENWGPSPNFWTGICFTFILSHCIPYLHPNFWTPDQHDQPTTRPKDQLGRQMPRKMFFFFCESEERNLKWPRPNWVGNGFRKHLQ